MFDLDNASHTVIEQSNAATNPYFVNTSFPTGTKVSRGVPDCFAFDQTIAVNVNCLSFACLFLFPTGTKVSRGVPDFNDISYSELYEK